MTDWDGHNRRSWRRWEVHIDASLEIGTVTVPGTIRDISRGGLLFETRRPLDVGEEAQLVHRGPLGKSTVRVIRRVLEADGTTRLGLAFVAGSPVPGTPMIKA
jgi:hypothetical protein